MALDQAFHSLEDFLASTVTDVDAVLDDGSGVGFPVKGREIEATVLFADISGFSTRSLDLSPLETLIFVQNFFTWISGEALHGRPGIVDKYIGDEVMVVFSSEFGSADPFADAVQAAAAMSRRDVHAYAPHIGIASGRIIVGYAGTPLRYSVSVFGAPVALAARCAGVKADSSAGVVSSSIAMPSADWGDRDFETTLPAEGYYDKDGKEQSRENQFVLRDPRSVPMKGFGDVLVREIHNTGLWIPGESATDRAIAGRKFIESAGRYWPRKGRDR